MPEDEVLGSSASAILGDVTLDTAGLVRSVVQVDGCSGVLVGPRVAISTAHCWWQRFTGCATPYTPAQAEELGDLLTGMTVRVAPPNLINFNDPATDVYGIESMRMMPSFMSSIGTTCCESPTGCSECTGWDDTLPLQWNMAHDLVVVRLDRDVTGVTPENVIFGVGGDAQAFGVYDFEPEELVGVTMVAAGTSGTSAAPQLRLRAYGTFEVDSIQSAQTLSPFVVVDDWWECGGPWKLATFDAPGAYLNYDPQAQGSVCSFLNDSGGPTFFNAPALGGDAIAGLPTGRLVGAVHTRGTMNPPNCASDARHTTTWNLEYTLDVDQQGAQVVVGQNGEFIRKSLTDFDGDMIPDAYDNCPNVRNPGQENCNAIAEDAKGYERRGDACDPRPCAHGRIEPGQKVVGSSSGGSPQLQKGIIKRPNFKVDPRPSMPFYNGATDGKDAGSELAIAPANVPTKYRFCQNDQDKGVNCESPSTVSNGYVDLADGPIGSFRPFLRMRVKEPGASGLPYDQETFTYDGSSEALRGWDYEAHKQLWYDINGWISVAGGSGSFGTTTGLSGRLWVHADTQVGTLSAGSATGYRLSLAGTTTGDAELSNHYVPYAPDAPFEKYTAGLWTPWPYFEWISPWDPWDALEPGWDGVMQEAATIIHSNEGLFARIQRTGEAIVIDDALGTGLKSLMAQSVVWGPAAEASLWQAHKGAHESPHAVAFKDDGTDVFDGVWLDGAVRGNATDVSEPSLARLDGPSARTAFTPVYSRADDLAFVVGGESSGIPTGEIWYRSVEGPDVPWTRIALGGGYAPRYVKAATWSPREQKLWVLDQIGSLARLTRVHPATGHTETIYSGTWTGSYDRHWMRLALDGSVMLFGSSTSLDRHGAAVFDAAPMVVWAEVSLAQYQAPVANNGKLLYRPVVDPRGMTFVVAPRDRTEVLRREALTGGPAALSSLSGML